MVIKFHELEHQASLKYSVIISEDKNGYVFFKHKNRDIRKIPGGHMKVNPHLKLRKESWLKKQEQRILNWWKYVPIQSLQIIKQVMEDFSSPKSKAIQVSWILKYLKSDLLINFLII